MREIEFKAKCLRNNQEWVFGSFVSFFGTIQDENQDFDIDLKTVSQYTMFKDKNIKKIFEGDIVKIGSQIGYIVYEYGSFGIGFLKEIDYKKLKKKTISWFGIENDNFLPLLEVYWNFNDEDEILSEVEILGNIYDNPELLEG